MDPVQKYSFWTQWIWKSKKSIWNTSPSHETSFCKRNWSLSKSPLQLYFSNGNLIPFSIVCQFQLGIVNSCGEAKIVRFQVRKRWIAQNDFKQFYRQFTRKQLLSWKTTLPCKIEQPASKNVWLIFE